MSNWSEGYVDGINYTAGYYANLNPHQLITPFLMANLQPPKVVNACELGFGLGVSLNMHAAAGYAKWYATDFNPSQALFAQSLADCGDKQKVLIADQAFAEFCQRDDLPDFDFIGLHGIWSWISPENREVIVDFIARKLKVGGVLYISYNTLPGWSANAPLRHLFAQHYQRLSLEQSIEHNIKTALQSTHQIISQSEFLLAQAPTLKARVESLNDANVNYLAHEYLNQDWHPMYFAEMENYLQKAKLSYACSANYLDDYDDILFNEEQKQILANINNSSLQQTTKDFFLNKQFRCDYWVKGKLTLDNTQTEKLWRQLSVVLAKPVAQIEQQIQRHYTISFKEELLNPILQRLDGYQIHTVHDLCQQLADVMPARLLFNVLAILIARDDVVLTQPSEVIAAQKPTTQKLNQAIMDKTLTNNQLSYLASPVSGGGVAYSNVEMLFLSAYQQNIATEAWEKYAWDILHSRSLLLTKDGESLQTEAENLAELTQLKTAFLQEKLPIAQALQVV